MTECALVLDAADGGTLFRVRAHAGARRDGVAGIHDGALKVDVTDAPERGKANKAILRLLAATLGVRPADLELRAGKTSPRKTIFARGVSPTAARARFAPWTKGI